MLTGYLKNKCPENLKTPRKILMREIILSNVADLPLATSLKWNSVTDTLDDYVPLFIKQTFPYKHVSNLRHFFEISCFKNSVQKLKNNLVTFSH